MGSVEAKPPAKSVKRYLNVGFVAGFLLVLLTYLVVSQQFAVNASNALSRTARRVADKEAIMGMASSETGTQDDRGGGGPGKKTGSFAGSNQEQEHTVKQQQQQSAEGERREDASGAVQTPGKDAAAAKPSAQSGKVVCNTDGPFSDTCDLDGDVRTNGTALSVTLVPAAPSERREWKIRPYSRRNMVGVEKVTVTQLDSPSAAPACNVTHGVPAVVFALGGHAGNYFHDFSDVLVPLFAAARTYAGEVQLLVSNIQPWWLAKYAAVVRGLSRYDAVDLDGDRHVRCFLRVTVGLRIYKELSLSPERTPGGVSMVDFTAFLRETYALPRSSPAVSPSRRPRLLLIHRGHYRRILNTPEIVAAAEAAGFETVVMEPKPYVSVAEVAREVNSFDVLVGVHGAGLTNMVFLPARAVVVQVVPWGKLERLARTDFGSPAADMGLRYLEYGVAAEESSLLEMLGPEHPVVKDPESVHRSGWDKVAEYYLGKQDVRLNVTRFAPTLAMALDHLRRL